MNKNKLISKIRKSSQKACSVSKFFTIMGIILILGVIIIAVKNISSAGSLDAPLDKNFESVITIDDKQPASVFELLYAMIAGIIQFSIFTVCTALATKIFGNIASDGIPFKKANTKRLSAIGNLIIFSSVIPYAASWLICLIISLVSGTDMNFSVRINLDLGIILVGILFSLITSIFSYGAIIQQENDDMV